MANFSTLAGLVMALGGGLWAPSAASAQSPVSNDYRVEIEAGIWHPSRDLVVTTGSSRCVRLAGRVFVPAPCTDPDVSVMRSGGSPVDLGERFLVGRRTLPQFKAAVRLPFRQSVAVDILPTAYEGTANLNQFVELNGQAFGIGMQASADVTWRFTSARYQWDPLSSDRWAVGAVASLNYSSLTADITAQAFNGTRFVSYRREILVPALGISGAIRIAAPLSFAGVYSPLPLDRWRSDVDFHDFDIHATIDVKRRYGIRVGYRSVSLDYRVTESPEASLVNDDTGHHRMRAPYLTGLVRF